MPGPSLPVSGVPGKGGGAGVFSPHGVASSRLWAASGASWLTGYRASPPLLPSGTAAAHIAHRLAAISKRASNDALGHIGGASLLSERAALTGRWRSGDVSIGGSCRLLRSLDGWAAVSMARDADVQMIGVMLGGHDTADLWAELSAWLAVRSGDEFEAMASELGIPGGVVTHDPGPATAIPTGFEMRSVQDLLVVDFSSLWAGPLCSRILAAAGAQVIKVETPSRPDGARQGNRQFYDLMHSGHEAIVLDPESPDGRAAMRDLVDRADIVIEASRPRALQRFGLDAESVVAAGATWVSITAAGRASPRIGFGDDVAASAGLVAWTEEGAPVFVGDAIADPLTGVEAAWCAMHAAPSGGGRLWDVSMADVVRSVLPPEVSPAIAAQGDESTGWAFDVGGEVLDVAMPMIPKIPENAALRSGATTSGTLRRLGIAVP